MAWTMLTFSSVFHWLLDRVNQIFQRKKLFIISMVVLLDWAHTSKDLPNRFCLSHKICCLSFCVRVKINVIRHSLYIGAQSLFR